MFIVIEGIDGAGKGRQRTELVRFLSDKNLQIVTTDFPDHEGKIYKHLIHPALHEEYYMNDQAWFLAFMLDQLLWKEKIINAIGSHSNYFISDGYFTTTLAYQCELGGVMTLQDAEDLALKLALPKPDLIIFIDVDPDIAMQRKMDEEGHDEGLDIFERNIAKQHRLRKAFLNMSKNNVWTNWSVVNGNGPIEEVKQEVVEALKNFNLI